MREKEQFEKCVYINPNYDYKKSQQIYNLKYNYPGFIENGATSINERNSMKLGSTTAKSGFFSNYQNVQLLTSLSNPKMHSIKQKFKRFGQRNNFNKAVQRIDLDPYQRKEEYLHELRKQREEAVNARRRVNHTKRHIDGWLEYIMR